MNEWNMNPNQRKQKKYEIKEQWHSQYYFWFIYLIQMKNGMRAASSE